MTPLPRLTGRVALITGAARGMGAAEAIRFAEEGAQVAIADVSRSRLDEVASGIEHAHPGTVLALTLDVTQPDDWARAVAATVTRFGNLHILVNNAGVTGEAAGTPIEDYPIDDWLTTMAVNSTGAFHGLRAAIPVIRASVSVLRQDKPTVTGSIINVSSGQAMRPSAGNSAYAASKWALRGLTKVAALETAPLIRVNSVHPGPILTELAQQAIARGLTTEEQLGGALPLKRLGTPDEIAALAVFLAGDESSFCTGSEFTVDGGRLIAS